MQELTKSFHFPFVVSEWKRRQSLSGRVGHFAATTANNNPLNMDVKTPTF